MLDEFPRQGGKKLSVLLCGDRPTKVLVLANAGPPAVRERLRSVCRENDRCVSFSLSFFQLCQFLEGIYRRAGICCIVLLCLDRPPHVVATQPSPRGPEPENIHRARSPAQSIPSRANWLSSCKRKRISTFSFADDI